MDPDTADSFSTIAKILGGGGLLAFAGAVWQEMRTQRKERSETEARWMKLVEDNTKAFVAVMQGLTTILEHVRIQTFDSGPVRKITNHDQ